MLASAERLMEAEELVDDATHAKPIAEILDLYDKELNSIGLKNVSFTYYSPSGNIEETDKNDMPIVLSGLSLEVKKGTYTAFTGHSGCGKSTALKLLMCV